MNQNTLILISNLFNQTEDPKMHTVGYLSQETSNNLFGESALWIFQSKSATVLFMRAGIIKVT